MNRGLGCVWKCGVDELVLGFPSETPKGRRFHRDDQIESAYVFEMFPYQTTLNQKFQNFNPTALCSSPLLLHGPVGLQERAKLVSAFYMSRLRHLGSRDGDDLSICGAPPLEPVYPLGVSSIFFCKIPQQYFDVWSIWWCLIVGRLYPTSHSIPFDSIFILILPPWFPHDQQHFPLARWISQWSAMFHDTDGPVDLACQWIWSASFQHEYTWLEDRLVFVNKSSHMIRSCFIIYIYIYIYIYILYIYTQKHHL